MPQQAITAAGNAKIDQAEIYQARIAKVQDAMKERLLSAFRHWRNAE